MPARCVHLCRLGLCPDRVGSETQPTSGCGRKAALGEMGGNRLNASPRSAPELEALTKIYYASPNDLADFQVIQEQDLPPVYHTLLAHHLHMTVTLEAHSGCPVEVEVLRSERTATHYQRKILLRRMSDQGVVLFGIVRITLALLPTEVRQEIETESMPLGTILINRNVYRNVRLLSFWQVRPGDELREIFELESPELLYGRTALIYCDDVPVIELLEIVTAD
jgi:chorismate-pyruvate lyase